VKVIETFTSLQGESTRQGRRCFFIRLAGCNLRCRYCDTSYAWEGGKDCSVEELVKLAVAADVPLVEVTGGEPLLSPETPRLCQALLNEGLEVLVETNGSFPVSLLPAGAVAVVDVKTPGSGMAEHHDFANCRDPRTGDEYKFVLSGREDFDYALKVVREYHLDAAPVGLIVSPVAGAVDPADIARWILETHAPFRLQLQLHKILWGNRPGV